MAEGVNVTFAGELQKFIQKRTGESGPYASASEYLRDLVRLDYEREDQLKETWLQQELEPGVLADVSEFVALDADELIAGAKLRRQFHGR